MEMCALNSLVGFYWLKLVNNLFILAHCRIKTRPVIRGVKVTNLYLITTTIRYCPGSVPIHPFSHEFVLILLFSIRVWSDLCKAKSTTSIPTASWFSRRQSDSDRTINRLWWQDLDAIETQSARNGNKIFLQIIYVYHGSVPINRTPPRRWPDKTEHGNDFNPIQQKRSRL